MSCEDQMHPKCTKIKITFKQKSMKDTQLAVATSSPTPTLSISKKIRISKKIIPATSQTTAPSQITPPTLKSLSDIKVPPFKMKANDKIALLTSHFLSIAKLVKQTLDYYKSEDATFPFTICPTSKQFSLYNTNSNTFELVASKDIIIDDITLKAWKFVANIHDILKQKDLLEDVYENMGDYAKFRVEEFIESYQEFMAQRDFSIWGDFKDQVLDIIYQHFNINANAK